MALIFLSVGNLDKYLCRTLIETGKSHKNHDKSELYQTLNDNRFRECLTKGRRSFSFLLPFPLYPAGLLLPLQPLEQIFILPRG